MDKCGVDTPEQIDKVMPVISLLRRGARHDTVRRHAPRDNREAYGTLRHGARRDGYIGCRCALPYAMFLKPTVPYGMAPDATGT